MKASVCVGLGIFGISLSAAAQQNSDLSAGGLAPPEAIESESDQAEKRQQTEADLDKAEKEDAGRGLEFFWLNGEFGVEHLGLQTFRSDNLVDVDVVDTTQTGIVYGGGLGLRMVFLTLGARFRMASPSAYKLWTLNGEAGVRIPLGALEPYFTLGGGYASLGSFESSDLEDAEVDIDGFNVRGGAGIDYYLTETLSLGGNLTGDVLFLWRGAVDANAVTAEQLSAIYANGGSSIGGAAALTLVVGLHF